ncbi:MAG: hypothetical protein HRT57_14820 [Crocinitomicaceae bacterium]|nr:hypothetical protein [Crocinitomicaceae bacterium]
MGRLYIGTELRIGYNENYMSFLETNLHLGFSYMNMRIRRYIPQIYIHCGLAKDVSDRNKPGLLPLCPTWNDD